MADKKESKLAQWLDQLQEQSWNLELIISGFALFGLFQLREFLVMQIHYSEANDSISPYYIGYSIVKLRTGLDIFIFSLLTLVFIRGLWIGALGLRYVSGEIDFDQLKYSNPFKQYLKNKVGNFDNYIHKLENLSSTIFAFTYILFFTVCSIIFYDIELQFLAQTIYEIHEGIISQIIVLLFLGAGILVAFDFLTLGWLKSIKFSLFAKVYLLIYKVVGVLTLSFLWRPLWYNFIDQRAMRWIAALVVPFLIAFIILDDVTFRNFSYSFFPKLNYNTEYSKFSSIYYKENARASFQHSFYDDLRQIEKANGNYQAIDVMSLPSRRVEVPILEVFVKYTKFIDNYISEKDSSLAAINKVGLNSLDEFGVLDITIIRRTKSAYDKQYEERLASSNERFDSVLLVDKAEAEELAIAFQESEQLRYRSYLNQVKSIIKQSFSFEINDQAVPDSSINLSFHVHPNLGEKGYICTFPIENTRLGTNYLTLKQKFLYGRQEGYHERDFSIPFIYTGVKR